MTLSDSEADFNVVSYVPPAERPKERRIRLHPYVGRDPKLIPRRQWHYPGLYCATFLTTTVAPGGMGKTGLSMVEALAMTTGRDLLNDGVKNGPLRVWFWNGEDPYEELERQLEAAKIYYGLSDEDIGGRLFIDSGRDLPLKIARVAKGQAELVQQDVDEITAELTDRGVDVAVFDPFVTLHSVPESSNDAIDIVATALAQIANDTRAAIGVVAHSRKLAPGSGGEITADDNRGASALVNKSRVARVLNRMRPEEAEKAGLPLGTHLRYFRVGGDGNKQNLTPPSEDKTWRFNASVDLPNGYNGLPGDSVRVCTPWRWPDAFDDVLATHVDQIRVAISIPPDGGKNWRADVQSMQWAGKAIAQVLGMNPDDIGKSPLDPKIIIDKAGTEKVKAILREWLKNDVLAAVQIEDEHRKMRPCIVSGSMKRDGTAKPSEAAGAARG